MRWPLNFKPLGIEKYDGATNLAEWFEVYQLTIEATGGDSYITANYLPVCLSSSARTWLLGLPSGYVRSWSQLCRLFTSNFRATCTRSEVYWNLDSIVQKKGESLKEFIQRVCNKRNLILEVDDKSIIMFFKKGLTDSSLVCKISMKNPKTSEEMLAITNKYALAEEATLDTREQKKKKESGHTVSHPQSNGQVECSNGIILHGMKPRLFDRLKPYSGKWVKELPSVLWALHTTLSRAMGYTSFVFVYGFEAMTRFSLRETNVSLEAYEA
jgi:hypothetical protein